MTSDHDDDHIEHHVAGVQEIKTIPIDRIRILNPRVRSQNTFAGIVESIATVGLKRPITVAEGGLDEHGQKYDLRRGERFEAESPPSRYSGRALL